MSRRIAAEQGRRLQSWHALHRRLADDIIAVNDTVPSTFFYPLESIRDQSGSRTAPRRHSGQPGRERRPWADRTGGSHGSVRDCGMGL